MPYNVELNDFRIIIWFKKSEISVERFSVCNVIEKLVEHGMLCMPCSKTKDIMYIFTRATKSSYSCLCDVIENSFCQGTKHNSW